GEEPGGVRADRADAGGVRGGRARRAGEVGRRCAMTTTGAKHTPGPLHTAEYETHYAVKRGSEILATGIRKEADARLYAAAPDLLAACKTLLNFARSVRPGGGVLAGEEMIFREADAAIAKAKGGQD